LVHTSRGVCFWQWGSTTDFKSYVLGCPAEKIGVVILTNSSRGQMVTREIAANALGE